MQLTLHFILKFPTLDCYMDVSIAVMTHETKYESVNLNS